MLLTDADKLVLDARSKFESAIKLVRVGTGKDCEEAIKNLMSEASANLLKAYRRDQ